MMVNEELKSWMRVDRFVCTVLIDLRVYVCIWRWIGYSLLWRFLFVSTSRWKHDLQSFASAVNVYCLFSPTGFEVCSINSSVSGLYTLPPTCCLGVSRIQHPGCGAQLSNVLFQSSRPSATSMIELAGCQVRERL